MKTASSHDALNELAREVRLLFHQLRATAEALAEDPDRLTAGHRGVLESLQRDGAQTVPDLARARPVSRQHIQTLVNRLLELELVATRPNPAHRGSPLIELTSSGRRRFGAMLERERAALTRSRIPVSSRRLSETTETLRQLRRYLADLPPP